MDGGLWKPGDFAADPQGDFGRGELGAGQTLAAPRQPDAPAPPRLTPLDSLGSASWLAAEVADARAENEALRSECKWLAEQVQRLDESTQRCHADLAALRQELDSPDRPLRRQAMALKKSGSSSSYQVGKMPTREEKLVQQNVKSSKESSNRSNNRTPEDTLEVTSHRLDASNMYVRNESIWDVCIFTGHSSLGTSVSIALVVACIINFLLQSFFCIVIWMYMVGATIDNEFLDGLLRFRVGAAHNVDLSDKVLQQSMVEQVCKGNAKLHMAGQQMEFFWSTFDFLSGGRELNMLAQFAWLATIVRELDTIWQLSRALVRVPLGDCTRVITAESDSPTEGTDALLKEESALINVTVVTRIKQFSKVRYWSVMAFLVVPRVLIAVSLGVIGVLYLARSSQMEDLVLNAIALEFIINIDELMYTILIPRRAQTLLANLEPLRVPHRLGARCVGLHVLPKYLFLGASMIAVSVFLLDPLFWRLDQAQDILCSGNTKFVYAVNGATGVVHVTEMAGTEAWTDIERAVLQVAQPKLNPMYGWELDPELLAISKGPSSQHPWYANGVTGSGTMTEIDGSQYAMVAHLTSASVTESVEGVSCQDMSAGPHNGFMLNTLRALVNDSTVTGCEDIAQYCSFKSMVQLRALCPVTCDCDMDLGGSGFFSTTSSGCPTSCVAVRNANEEFKDRFNYAYLLATGSPMCTDYPPASLIESPASVECFNNRSRCDDIQGHVARWFALYIRGLFESLFSDYQFFDGLADKLPLMQETGMLPPGIKDEIYEFIENGGFARSLLDNTWLLLPYMAHPRGKTGCDFLLSFEVQGILGVDLCKVGAFSSLRPLCPERCGCGTMEECPKLCMLDGSDDLGIYEGR